MPWPSALITNTGFAIGYCCALGITSNTFESIELLWKITSLQYARELKVHVVGTDVEGATTKRYMAGYLSFFCTKNGPIERVVAPVFSSVHTASSGFIAIGLPCLFRLVLSSAPIPVFFLTRSSRRL